MNQNASTGALLPLLLATLIAGACMPVQGGVNSRLGKEIGGPIAAALISFTVGVISLLIVALATKAIPFPSGASLAKIPYWMWTGGFLGAFFVTLSAIAVPKLGFALFSGGVIAGQLIASILLDHFGAFGMERQPITLARVGGIALLFAGIWLLRR